MELAFEAAVERDRIEQKVRAVKAGRRALDDLDALVRDGTITGADAEALTKANAIVREAIDVDDFAPNELTQRSTTPRRPAQAAE